MHQVEAAATKIVLVGPVFAARHNALHAARHVWTVEGTKWGLAALLACPTCGGGALLALGGLSGIGAAALRTGALAVVALTLACLWAANASRRRGERLS